MAASLPLLLFFSYIFCFFFFFIHAKWTSEGGECREKREGKEGKEKVHTHKSEINREPAAGVRVGGSGMLLCKQPGDTGVFATATQHKIKFYRLSSSSQLLRETKAGAATITTTTTTSVAVGEGMQMESNTAGNEWESAFTRTAPSSPIASVPPSMTRKRCGTPIDASCVIPLSQFREEEVLGVAGGAARGFGRLYISHLQPNPPEGKSSGDESLANVPLTLSLSCARDDTLRFLYSGKTLGAWIGAENTVSALCTTSVNGAPYDAGYHNHRAEIVASGWDPLDASALAIGRRSGVVQLLNIENSNGMLSSTSLPLNLVAAESFSVSNGCQASFGTTPIYPSAVTRNTERMPLSVLSVNVVQERLLKGTLTSLDWAPRSHKTVVAAERSDGIGHCVEVMDLRSPDNGIRYLGMPFETTSPASTMSLAGTGSSISEVCFAEFVACDCSGIYVATVGSQSRRDVAQLWDLRMTSRPVCRQSHSRVGYTSLNWSTHEIPTVIATTRNGGLRVHVFSDFRSETEEDEGALTETEGNRTSGRSVYAPFYSSLSKRTAKPFDERFHPQPRVPAASVAWLDGCRSHVRCSEGEMAEENGVGKQGEPRAQHGPSQRVAGGSRTDIPCLLLLDAKTGELYPQVFFPVGCKATMIGDVPLCSAGPNVFILDSRCLFEGQPERKSVEPDGTSFNNNSMGSAGTHINYDPYNEMEKGGVAFCNSAESTPTNCAGMATLAAVNATAKGVYKGNTHVDRHLHRLDRLRAGFVPQSDKVLSTLLKEQSDREAYVLFRYGWYAQRYLYPGRATLPVPDVIPGLLELLERERRPINSGIPEAFCGVRKLILLAAGWVTDPREERLMLTPAGGGGDDDDGHVERTVQVPSRLFSPSEPTLAGLPPQHQPLREKSTTVSSNLCSRGSADEGMEATDLFFPTSQGELSTLSASSLKPADHVEMASFQEAVERRVAILVFMFRLNEAAALLCHYNHLHPLYSTFAMLLLAATANRNGVPPTLTLDVSECSFWIELCFFFMNAFRTSATPSTVPEERKKDYRAKKGVTNKNDGGDVDEDHIGEFYRSPPSARRECFASFVRCFPQIPLSDRIALATHLLLDPSPTADGESQCNILSEVLREMVQQQFYTNATGGCSLFLAAAVEGVRGSCVPLQRYVDETGDVQTPVAYVALYGSGKGASWRQWNEAYRSQLNAEGHAILRSLHDLSCKKLARLREQQSGFLAKRHAVPPPEAPLGRLVGLSSPAVGLMGVPFSGLVGGAAAETKTKPKRKNKRNVELRCKCGKVVATSPMESADTVTIMGRRQQSLCGSINCLTPMCVVCGEPMFALASGYDVDSSFTWCTVCLHGGHWSHLRDWFAKHRKCPAEDCLCNCYCPSLSP
ncbi:hypothetical protein C4B63_267g21 [Trypanosoma cruzi]|uniref:WD repeat protein mio zinc-ribbon like domain-containing protein n=1 Tax=Trypanosoma cruzi TaxID=5693 RepID=A0A2V2UNR5_TRYCR|nr:hypothetical protein C4B63_267g21 [Trypanosoma cruzi]